MAAPLVLSGAPHGFGLGRATVSLSNAIRWRVDTLLQGWDCSSVLLRHILSSWLLEHRMATDSYCGWRSGSA